MSAKLPGCELAAIVELAGVEGSDVGWIDVQMVNQLTWHLTRIIKASLVRISRRTPMQPMGVRDGMEGHRPTDSPQTARRVGCAC